MMNIILIFFTSLILLDSNHVTPESCNCDTIATNMEKAASPNQAIMAYADFQLFQLEILGKVVEGFLSSGHTTGSNVKSYKNASATIQKGITALEAKRSEIEKATIKDAEKYIFYLQSVNSLGTKYFKQAEDLIGLKKDGKKTFTANGSIAEYPECINVGASMKNACLNGIQRMANCGIYEVLGLQQMRDDQEKCDGKGAAAMKLCADSNGAYDGYYDMSMEETKALMSCEEHDKTVGGGKQLQTQTWDGF